MSAGTPRKLNYVIKHGAPRVKRFEEQRWLIDNVIKANGIDWDQPRSIYLSAPCGGEAAADFASIRMRVQKLADATPAFEAAAKRREGRALAFEKDGATISARDNYFMACVHYGAAMWPIDESNAQNIALNQRKRECYLSYARLASASDHIVEEAWAPLGNGKELPAWFHLPYNYKGGRVPAVMIIPGMDSFKETSVSLNGDRWLSRGIAVLAIDGPGQYECPLIDIPFTMDAWERTAKATMDWLAARPEIDADKIGVTGTSFGSFYGTIVAAAEPRYKACAVTAPCLEPGCHTIFQEASPTFKQRYMFMSDMTDEAEFDVFRECISWKGYAEKINCPYLCIAGESDELGPVSGVEDMFAAMHAPRQLMIYQDSRHAIGTVPSSNLGPFATGYAADWMAARLQGTPFESERWFIEASGRIDKRSL